MRRKVFDVLISAEGLLIVAVLLVAGALLMWGYSFATSSVHDQLARQEIFFPSNGGAGVADRANGTFLVQYAGQQVLSGPQAKAYADDEISPDLSAMPDGATYARISAESPAHPKNTELASLALVSSRETALRGLLLEAYDFWIFGQVVLWAAILAFILAGLLALLVGLGLRHSQQVPDSAEILAHARTRFGARLLGIESQGGTERQRVSQLPLRVR